MQRYLLPTPTTPTAGAPFWLLVCDSAAVRFGGGKLKTDMDHDGTPDSSGADKEMKSAYIVLDITNPESTPKVLAEITFDDLGYTTSYPGVVVMDPKDTATANDWYLVLGWT
jgi:type IV pilus assembly protein PilY1